MSSALTSLLFGSTNAVPLLPVSPSQIVGIFWDENGTSKRHTRFGIHCKWLGSTKLSAKGPVVPLAFRSDSKSSGMSLLPSRRVLVASWNTVEKFFSQKEVYDLDRLVRHNLHRFHTPRAQAWFARKVRRCIINCHTFLNSKNEARENVQPW